MKFFCFLVIVFYVTGAKCSNVYPVYLEACQLYVEDRNARIKNLYLSQEISLILELFESYSIKPSLLRRSLMSRTRKIRLRDDDRFDSWILNPEKSINSSRPISVHAHDFKIMNASDDWLGDDIFVYFFLTDGHVPSGKVSSVYRDLRAGQRFFFSELDRVIYPVSGFDSKIPDSHLIIDYGIIESDGDDVKELQKLSMLIIDMVMAYYSLNETDSKRLMITLRKEVKALSEFILSLNKDDRLATGTMALKTSELDQMFGEKTIIIRSKKHVSGYFFDKWDYRIGFRFLRI